MTVQPPCLHQAMPFRPWIIGILVLGLTFVMSYPVAAQAPAPAKPNQPEAKAPAKPVPAPAAKPKPETKPARPQPLVEMPVEEAFRKSRVKIGGIIKGETLTPEQRTQLTDYYTKYALSRWTKKGYRADVRKFRNELSNDLRMAKGAAHAALLDLTLDFMKTTAQGNHTMVARVNAVLMIGELNDVESPRPSASPVPMARALPELLATAADPQAPDALKVAALVGIKRHADLEAITGGALPPVLTLLVHQATAEPARGRSSAGHTWIQNLTIDTLAAMKTPGPNGQVAQVLLAIVNQAGVPLPTRCLAARALGKLKYPSSPGIVPVAAIRQIGQLAVETIKDEVAREEADESSFVRRRLHARLIVVYDGLKGMALLVTETADVALHTRVLALLKDCLETLEDEDLTEEDVIEALDGKAVLIAKVIEVPAAKPATAKPTTP